MLRVWVHPGHLVAIGAGKAGLNLEFYFAEQHVTPRRDDERPVKTDNAQYIAPDCSDPEPWTPRLLLVPTHDKYIHMLQYELHLAVDVIMLTDLGAAFLARFGGIFIYNKKTAF